MHAEDDLEDLDRRDAVTVTLPKAELAQLEALLDTVHRKGKASTWWAQFRPLIDALRSRFKRARVPNPEELTVGHWLNFFTTPSGKVETP